MSNHTHRQLGAGSSSISPYASAETSPSQSMSASIDSFQSATLRDSRSYEEAAKQNRFPLGSHPLADLADPCIKVIQTSASSQSLARIGDYANTDFQSLPPNIQYSMDQCNARPLVHTVQDLENMHHAQHSHSSKSIRSVIEESIDEQLYKSLPPAHTMTAQQRSALSLIDEMLNQRSSSSASGSTKHLQCHAENPMGGSMVTSTSSPNPESGPFKLLQTNSLSSSSLSATSNLIKSPSHQSHQHSMRVNTLSPNGSTINDAVAIFQSATIGNSLSTTTTTLTTTSTTQQPKSGQQSPMETLSNLNRSEQEKVDPAVNSSTVSNTSMHKSSSVSKMLESSPPKEQRPPKSSPKNREGGKSEVMSPSKSSPSLHKHIPSSSQEFCHSLNMNLVAAASAYAAKDKDSKKETSSSNKKDSSHQSKDEAKPQQKEEKSKEASHKSSKHNKTKGEQEDKKNEAAKDNKKDSKKSTTTPTVNNAKFTSNAHTCSIHNDLKKVVDSGKDAATKPKTDKKEEKQRSDNKREENKTKASSSGAQTKNKQSEAASNKQSVTTTPIVEAKKQQEPKQQQSKSKSSKTQTPQTAHVPAGTYGKSLKHEETVNSENLIKSLMAKLDKSAKAANNKSSGKKTDGEKQKQRKASPEQPEKLKYSKEFLIRIRTDRDQFIKTIYPDIFKAYSYCMSGNYWDPEKYFDIVQFQGDYQHVPTANMTVTNTHKKPYHQPKPHQPNYNNNNNNNYHYGPDNNKYTVASNPTKYTNVTHQNNNNRNKYNKSHNQSPSVYSVPPQVPKNSPKFEDNEEEVTIDQTAMLINSDRISMLTKGARELEHELSQRAFENPVEQLLFNLLKNKSNSISTINTTGDDYNTIMDFLRTNKPEQQAKFTQFLTGQSSDFSRQNVAQQQQFSSSSHQRPTVLTAQELEQQLSSVTGGRFSPTTPHYRAVAEEQMGSNSQAYKQLVRNLNNHPLSTPPTTSHHRQSPLETMLSLNHSTKLQQMQQANKAESSDVLKHMLHIESEQQRSALGPFEMLQHQQQQNPVQHISTPYLRAKPTYQKQAPQQPGKFKSLYEKVQAQKAEAQNHFSSLLTKLMPVPVQQPQYTLPQSLYQYQQQPHYQNDLLRWFPEATTH